MYVIIGFVPSPPLAADDCPFSSLFFVCYFSGNEKRPCFDAYAETRTMLSRCHLVSRLLGLFAEMPTHSPRYNGHDPSQDTYLSPARSAVHLNDRFLRDFHQRPCSLRGRIRPLSPLHSLWCELYMILFDASSKNYIFFHLFLCIFERLMN